MATRDSVPDAAEYAAIDNQLCEAGAIVTSNISCVSGRDIIKFRKVVGLLNKREPI